MSTAKIKNKKFKPIKTQHKMMTLKKVCSASKTGGICKPSSSSTIPKSEIKRAGEKNKTSLPKAKIEKRKHARQVIFTFLFPVISNQSEPEKNTIQYGNAPLPPVCIKKRAQKRLIKNKRNKTIISIKPFAEPSRRMAVTP